MTNPSVPAEELPAVTVVIVNYNGRDCLADCLESLARLSYPSALVSICIVDNYSTDDSVAWVNQHFPRVSVIRLDANLGFAAGCNIGVRASDTPLVALLNNDTRVDTNWLSALVELKRSAPDIALVGAKMLSWDGKSIDFVQGVLAYYGHAFQRDFGRPVELYADDKPREILFACGGAMLCDREIYLSSGGFDAKYFAFFEDVDLSWRLWLMGYRVLFAPDAIVFHRGHATGSGVPFFQRLVLFERNALCTLYKNLDEGNVWRFLASSLLLVFKRQERWLNLDGLNSGEFKFNAPQSESAPLVPRREVISNTLAVSQFIDCLDDLQAQRTLIQSWRKRSDGEVFRLFEQALRPHVVQMVQPDAEYALAHYIVSAVSGITRQFAVLPCRVLLLSELCAPGQGETGLEARTALLASALRAAGHEVILLGPAPAGGESTETVQSITSLEPDWTNIVYRVNPDVVIACGYEVLQRLPLCHLPLVLDETRWPLSAESVPLSEALRATDFVTCGSPAQLQAATETLHEAGFSDPAKYSAIVAFDSQSDIRTGVEPLNQFCREPRKRRMAM